MPASLQNSPMFFAKPARRPADRRVDTSPPSRARSAFRSAGASLDPFARWHRRRDMDRTPWPTQTVLRTERLERFKLEVTLMEVQFVASVAPIVRDVDAARAFYRDALGLSFEGAEGDYAFTEKLGGTKHFGLWPLSEAATACFGTAEWPERIPVPQASIEFEVPDV